MSIDTDIPDSVEECPKRVLMLHGVDKESMMVCTHDGSDICGYECNADGLKRGRFPEGCPYYAQGMAFNFRFTSKYGEPH